MVCPDSGAWDCCVSDSARILSVMATSGRCSPKVAMDIKHDCSNSSKIGVRVFTWKGNVRLGATVLRIEMTIGHLFKTTVLGEFVSGWTCDERMPA